MPMKRIEIPAESAASVTLKSGQTCRIVNTEGGQVVDTWAFSFNLENAVGSRKSTQALDAPSKIKKTSHHQ